MKKLLLTCLVMNLISVVASAQQESFEFFKWNDVNHPLINWRSTASGTTNQGEDYGIPASNIDSKGNVWKPSYITEPKGFMSFYKNQTLIKINSSPNEKTGYAYYCNTISVNEKNTKHIVIYGYKQVYNSSTKVYTNYYDNYFVKYDSSGGYSYIHQKNLSDYDTLTNWQNVQSIGDQLLVLTNKKILWGSLIMKQLTFDSLKVATYPTNFFNDKKNTLYYISTLGSNNYKILTFHSDGTYQQRLQGKTIRNYHYNPENTTLTVYAQEGVFEISGKSEKQLTIPNYGKISNSSLIRSNSVQRGGYKLDILLTKRGICVNDGGNFTTHVFAENTSLGQDSLNFQAYYYNGRNYNLQDDSTLAISYNSSLYDSTYSTTTSKCYLFKYKKGVISLHKQYNLGKLGVYSNSTEAYYIGATKTYYYVVAKGSGIAQIKDDTVMTFIPTTGQKCSMYPISMVADKDFLWIANESNDTSNCAIARLRHGSYFVRGTVFYDANKSGYRDVNEFGYPKIKLVALPSGLQLIPDHEGNFAFKGEEGKTYIIQVVDTARFSWINWNEYNATMGVKLKIEIPEIRASFWLPRARCFTNRPSWFYLYNSGVVPVSKIKIRLIPENMKLLQDGLLIDTAVFTHENLGVNQWASLKYDIEWPSAALTGQTATLLTITDLYIDGQIALSRRDSIQAVIRCSYDPNDKSVTPVGVTDKHYTLKNNALEYQIRFENTGNDTAYHVVVKDTLNSNLDFSTFEVLGSSHKMNTEISSDGKVAFHFNYIMLPDTGADKLGAQGFVRFKIKPKSTVANNTLVCNKAAIYFDENKPVITNSNCNLLVDKIPTIITGLDNQPAKNGINLYPNPTSDWVYLPKDSEETTVYNAIGKEVLKSADSKINMAGYNEGMYVAKIRSKNGKVSTHKFSLVK
jgi:uncharacterized repeat protein (TIGR01451 family)